MVNRALRSWDPDLAAFAQELTTQKRSAHTIKNYTLTVNKFHEWLQEERKDPTLRLREAKAEDLKQYHIALVSQAGLAKNTLYITIKGLQAFYRSIGLDVAEGLRPPRRSQSLPKYLTESEARALLEAARVQPKDHALATLLLYAGLRVGELVRLEVRDLDFEERTIRIRSGKGDKDRLVVATPEAMEVVRAWLATRPKTSSDFLFPGHGGKMPITVMTAQRIVRRLAQEAGLTKHVTPHVLRHTLATTLLRRGGDIRFIQRILGHASIATTQIYTHLDDAELKRMYDEARPSY